MENKNLILALILSYVCSMPIAAQTNISIPDTTVFKSDTLLLPFYLNVDDDLDLFALKAEFSYDPTQFELLGVNQVGSISDSVLTVVNDDTEGEILLSIASVFPIKDSGVLIYFSLKMVTPGISLFYVTDLRLNEDAAFDPGVFGELSAFDFIDLEPNDSFEDAIEIVQNDTVYTTLNTLEDIDYFKFSAVEDQFLSIESFGLSNNFNLVITILDDTEGEILKLDGSTSDGREYLVFGAPYTGEYTLKIEHEDENLKLTSDLTKGLPDSDTSIQTFVAGFEDAHFEYQVFITDTVAHGPITLTAGSGFDNMVPLKWTITPSFAHLSVDHYNIYQFSSSSESFELVFTTTGFDFVVEGLNAGEEYNYAVSAVYKGNEKESELTIAESVAIPTETGFNLNSSFSETSVIVDGVFSSEEWDDASKIRIDSVNATYLFIKNDETHFYMAVVDSSGNQETLNRVSIYYDLDNVNLWSGNEGGYTVLSNERFDPILTYGFFTSFEGVYKGDFVSDVIGLGEGVEYAIVAEPERAVSEVVLTFEESRFNATVDDTVALLIVSSASGYFSTWPSGTVLNAQQTYGNVFLPATITSNEEVDDLATLFSLKQNYPNPFNPSTRISFTLPVASDVALNVYNLLGQQVSQVVNKRLTAGNHTVSFDASGLSSGIYLYKIEAGDFVQTKRMLLIK